MEKREITTAEYIGILGERLEKFKDKTIVELTDDEIQEFVELKRETKAIVEEFVGNAVQVITQVFGDILEWLKDNEEYIDDYNI